MIDDDGVGPVRRLRPVRLASVAGWGSRERKSALTLAVPFRYSRVQVYAGNNSSQRRTRALCSPTLAMFSTPHNILH